MTVKDFRTVKQKAELSQSGSFFVGVYSDVSRSAVFFLWPKVSISLKSTIASRLGLVSTLFYYPPTPNKFSIQIYGSNKGSVVWHIGFFSTKSMDPTNI